MEHSAGTVTDHTDAELARQPVGYWTGAAHEAVISFVNTQDAELGATQQHRMTLNTLARHTNGLSRAEITDELRAYLTGAEAGYPAVLDDLLDKGWLAKDAHGKLTLTEDGHLARVRRAEIAVKIRVRLHEGVRDADYVAALRVLQRIIANASMPS